ITRLKDIYVKRRNWRGLLDLYRTEVEVLEPPLQRGLFQEMAKLAVEKLDSPREAIVYWNRLLEFEPNDLEALSALELLYERERRWPALIEVLGRKLHLAANTGDVGGRVQSLTKLATLHSEQLRNEEKALELWQGVIALDPDNVRARRWVKELYVQRQNW